MAIGASAVHVIDQKFYGGRHRSQSESSPVEFSYFSKTIQVWFMLACSMNVVVTALYWAFLETDVDLFEVTSHVLPMIATTMEFFISRIVFEHNLSWVPFLYMFTYGFLINMPYTLLNGPVYPPLTFTTALSWAMAIGSTFGPVMTFFAFYGLQELKFLYIYRDTDIVFEEPAESMEDWVVLLRDIT